MLSVINISVITETGERWGGGERAGVLSVINISVITETGERWGEGGGGGWWCAGVSCVASFPSPWQSCSAK